MWNSTRTILRIGVMVAVVIAPCSLIGCQVTSRDTGVEHRNLLNLSNPVEDDRWALPSQGDGKWRVTVDSVDCGALVYGQPRHLVDNARASLISALSTSRNILVADRRVMRKIGSEYDIAASGNADPNSLPETGRVVIPQYILKATVMTLQRDVQEGKKEKGGSYIIGGSAASAEMRRGYVQIQADLIDINTASIAKSFTASADVADTREEKTDVVLVFRGSNMQATRVPESDAIRTASRQIASDIWNYFVVDGAGDRRAQNAP